MTYEVIMGLEVHVELSTKTKIFCSCPNVFGGTPNTHVCPTCTGMPGALPVINRKVIDYAMKAGLATNCQITQHTIFDRKNYFYPDLPSAYQISQLYAPICQHGYLDIQTSSGKSRIGIKEIHMEADAGKLMHDPWEDTTLVDYNRSGTPLLEIVSEPDFRTAEEVIAYIEKIRSIFQYLEISDCKMQEGSLRADVNLSVKPTGCSTLGTRTEMKNLNSLKAIGKAIQYEAQRQIEVIESGSKVVQETRRWDDNKDATFAMRSKENVQDYRYFPDPDLPIVLIDDNWIEAIRASLPELPEEKQRRYQKEYALSDYDTATILSFKSMADFFEATVSLCDKPKEVANWIMGDIFKMLKETGIEPDKNPITPQNLSNLIDLLNEGIINRNTAKTVFSAMFLKNADCIAYVKEHGLEMISDDTLILSIIQKVLEKNTKSIEDYKNGKEKAFGYLVGQCMRELEGKANPQAVNTLLKKSIEEIIR